MSTTQRLTLRIFVGLFFFAASGAARSAPCEVRSVTVRIEPERVAIGNAFLVWEMKLDNGRMSTVAITNRRTGKVTTFRGEDFVLEFSGDRKIASSEFRVEKVREEPLPGGGNQLVAYFTHADMQCG